MKPSMKNALCMILSSLALGSSLIWKMEMQADEKHNATELIEQYLEKEPNARLKRVDATKWGEDVINPFLGLDKDALEKLEKNGVDVQRLKSLQARLITGDYTGTSSKLFVNLDPTIILIFGSKFITQRNVYSAGPVLAIEDAHIMGDLIGQDLVWIAEQAKCRGGHIAGSPLFVREITGDPGWRRGDSFLNPLHKANPKSGASSATVSEKNVQKLSELIKSKTGTDVRAVSAAIDNPFNSITGNGASKLRGRGIEVDMLRTFKAFVLLPEKIDSDATAIVNTDPSRILMVKKDYRIRCPIFSAGPVIVSNHPDFTAAVVGSNLIWITGQTSLRCEISGAPLILSPDVDHGKLIPSSNDIWRGDYGWTK